MLLEVDLPGLWRWNPGNPWLVKQSSELTNTNRINGRTLNPFPAPSSTSYYFFLSIFAAMEANPTSGTPTIEKSQDNINSNRSNKRNAEIRTWFLVATGWFCQKKTDWRKVCCLSLVQGLQDWIAELPSWCLGNDPDLCCRCWSPAECHQFGREAEAPCIQAAEAHA